MKNVTIKSPPTDFFFLARNLIIIAYINKVLLTTHENAHSSTCMHHQGLDLLTYAKVYFFLLVEIIRDEFCIVDPFKVMSWV